MRGVDDVINDAVTQCEVLKVSGLAPRMAAGSRITRTGAAMGNTCRAGASGLLGFIRYRDRVRDGRFSVVP